MNEVLRKINDMSPHTENELDALICFGVDNFRYFTGITLPFAEYYPNKRFAAIFTSDSSGIIVPPEWKQVVSDQGWKENIIKYDLNKGNGFNLFIQSIEKFVKESGIQGGTIGFDASKTPVGVINEVKKRISNSKYVPIDEIITNLRIIKNNKEIDLIEKACEYIDRGIINALNHIEGTVDNIGYTITEYTERVRVHVFEAGGSGVGDLLVTFGSDTQNVYEPHKGKVTMNQLFRTDVTAHFMGYWSNLGRMGFIGETPKDCEDSFMENKILKSLALESLVPGEKCNNIFTKVKEKADSKGIKLFSNIIGHGVGVNQFESPVLSPFDSTELQKGMVLSLDITSYSSGKEIIHDKDIYEITNDGARKLSHYREWDRIYQVTGFRAVH